MQLLANYDRPTKHPTHNQPTDQTDSHLKGSWECTFTKSNTARWAMMDTTLLTENGLNLFLSKSAMSSVR